MGKTENRTDYIRYGGPPLRSLKNLDPETLCTLAGFDESAYRNYDENSEYPEEADWFKPEIPPHRQKIVDNAQIYEILNKAEPSNEIALGNKNLPAYKVKQEIITTLLENRVVIFKGETGCGKSTQIPQFAMEAGFKKTVLTQPRRMAARIVYERIGSELAEAYQDDDAKKLVSFITAGERQVNPNSKVYVVTDGLELAVLLSELSNEEEVLIIPDEVHEWNQNQETILAIIKDALDKNPKLSVAFMSATIDCQSIANHFTEFSGDKGVPIIEIEGRPHKTKWEEKPNSTVAKEAVIAAKEIIASNCDEENAILIFDPGLRQISDCIDEIKKRLPNEILAKARIFPLHAKMTETEQQKAVEHYSGVKIVVSTDVSQTSITIPDVKYVIDSGVHNTIELDDNGYQGLVQKPISRSDCIQRAGRCGRVFPGIYILTKLDKDSEFIPFKQRPEYEVPEIYRTDIVRNVLRLKSSELKLKENVLTEGIHPVSEQSILKSVAVLKSLGAVDADNNVTKIGEQMNKFPVRVSLARALVESKQYSQETQAYLAAIVACLEVDKLQLFGHDIDEAWKDLITETGSDAFAQLQLFQQSQYMTKTEQAEYNLDISSITRAQELFYKILRNLGNEFDIADKTVNDKQREEILACLLVGKINNIYAKVGKNEYQNISDKTEVIREIGRRSIVGSGEHPAEYIIGDPKWVARYHKDKSTSRNGQPKKQDEKEMAYEKIHILDNVSSIPLSLLSSFAIEHALGEWKPAGYQVRDEGYRVEEKQQLFVGDKKTRVTKILHNAEASPRLREHIIHQSYEHPGNMHQALRQLKEEIKQIRHLTKKPLRIMTHQDYLEIIDNCAPKDIKSPNEIEENLLRQYGYDLSGLKQQFITPDLEYDIKEAAPEATEIEGKEFLLKYIDGNPIVQIEDAIDIENLQIDKDYHLKDGRLILFQYKGTVRRLFEIKEELYKYSLAFA